MTDFDFCYWLMGYFELREHEPHVPSLAQIRMILAHAALVEGDGFAAHVREGLGASPQAVDEATIAALLCDLRAHFRAVIDPSYGPGLAQRLAIHEPHGYDD